MIKNPPAKRFFYLIFEAFSAILKTQIMLLDHRLKWLFWLLIAAFGLAVFVAWQNFLFFILFLLCLLVWALSYRLDFGWYILVFLSPMIQWVIDFYNYQFLFGSHPALLNINAPAVDFWAVILFLAFAVSLFRRWLFGQKIEISWLGFGLFSLFLISSALSLFNLPGGTVGLGIKYIVRFFLLVYFGFIFLGVNIVKDKRILDRSLLVLAATGVLAGVMGLVSLFLGVGVEVYGLPRSTPFAIGSWAPFGLQHVFLAETITTAFPVMVWFWYRSGDEKEKSIFGWLAVFSLVIGLLTLSRAGWIALSFGLVMFVFLIRDRINFPQIIKKFGWLAILVFPILIYLAYFLVSSPLVSTSTTTRWYLTEIALYLFAQHPILGSGVGNFLPTLNNIQFFWYEIGGSLTDAHGVVQKVLAEQGMLGAIGLGLFFAVFLRRLYWEFKKRNFLGNDFDYLLLGIFLIVMPLVAQLFGTSYYTAKLWVPVSIALIIINLSRIMEDHSREPMVRDLYIPKPYGHK